MVPKHRINDASNSHMPKRKHKVLLLSKKKKVLNLLGSEKKKFAKINNKNKFSICETEKVKMKLLLVLLWYFKLQKLWSVRKCLVKVKKALNLHDKIF